MKIDVFREGNQVGVLLGPDPVQGFCGFGDDLSAALRELATDLESMPGPFEAPERAKLRLEVTRMLRPVGKIHLVD
ncbi:MAG: hypothetical protein JWN34_3701 [Bryobacterales bacterium]|nr:hypothetical protein [Bryobacterales bacterium]